MINSEEWISLTGSGPYTGTFTFDDEGTISSRVIQFVQSEIYVEFYSDRTSLVTPDETTTWSQINEVWKSGGFLFGTYAFNVGMELVTYIKGPITGTVTLRLVTDDGADLSVDGVTYISNFGSSCVCEDSFDLAMSADSYYLVEISYQQQLHGSRLQFYWNYTGVSEEIIPSTSYYYSPTWLGSSPYNLTYTCPAGYSLTTGSPNACITTCGDGLRAGDEECDDGDTSKGDGCSSTCTVESGWVCSGGSTSSADTCTE